MMFTINYNYTIGDTVWIVDRDDILECQITQITLEIDPDGSGGVQEIKTYHSHVLDDWYVIKLRTEDVTFPSKDAAIDYMCDDTMINPPLPTHTIEYKYVPDDIVWTYDGQIPIEASVVQVTVDIDPDLIEKVIYHVLPTELTHSTLLRRDYEVFDTIEEATDYIQYLMEQLLTPTPTISITPTITPPLTPPTTPYPSVTPTMPVTPDITPTPTETPAQSPVWSYYPLD